MLHVSRERQSSLFPLKVRPGSAQERLSSPSLTRPQVKLVEAQVRKVLPERKGTQEARLLWDMPLCRPGFPPFKMGCERSKCHQRKTMSQCPEPYSSALDVAFSGLCGSQWRPPSFRKAFHWTTTLHDARATCELAIPDITQGKKARDPKLAWLFGALPQKDNII